MIPVNLKRQAEDVSLDNDDLDDECNVTWGRKKSRYRYTLNINESDQTESVQIQSKLTTNKYDFLSTTNCTSDSSHCDCNLQSSSQSNQSEFEDSKDVLLVPNDNGYIPEETDFQISSNNSEPNVLCTPRFTSCLQCRKINDNPYLQYCHNCFRYRMQVIENNPDPTPKCIKRLNIVAKHTEQSNSHKDSKESYTSNSQESGSFGISGLYLSQESTTETSENTLNSCNICYLKPKNGLFNHGKTSHLYCCYSCAKQIWSKSGKCPICNLKIRYVTKII